MIKNNEKLPSKVPLLGHVYTVRVVPRTKWCHGDENVGFCDNSKQVIEIIAELTPSQTWQAFWHEYLHAALHVMHDEREADEKFVDVLGGLIHQSTSLAS